MIVVAGHLCLDIIPTLSSETVLHPGVLIESGKAILSTGGAVSNVGISLHKLGAPVRLVGKVGPDPFGKIVRDLLRSHGVDESTQVDPHGDTSYTVVINPPGQDRMFIHCPGCNDTFVSRDVPESAFDGADHLHFGYPPLMAAMASDDGAELLDLFQRAKKFGLTTSLDMSLPDPASKQGQVPWLRLLEKVLPSVDLFLPSEDELRFMLQEPEAPVESLADRCHDLGCPTVVIKRGVNGLYGSGIDGKFFQPCFMVDEVGTTGSGDATIAGFLFARSRGMSFEECLQAGCAVGACCVEAADAISGIQTWDETRRRFLA